MILINKYIEIHGQQNIKKNINIKIDMGGKVAGVGKVRNVPKIFVGKPEGKRPFMRCKCR